MSIDWPQPWVEDKPIGRREYEQKNWGNGLAPHWDDLSPAVQEHWAGYASSERAAAVIDGIDTAADEQIKALFAEQARLECELAAERLREAFDAIEGTPYWANVEDVIGMLVHAEPTSMLHGFARILLGLPEASLGVSP